MVGGGRSLLTPTRYAVFAVHYKALGAAGFFSPPPLPPFHFVHFIYLFSVDVCSNGPLGRRYGCSSSAQDRPRSDHAAEDKGEKLRLPQEDRYCNREDFTAFFRTVRFVVQTILSRVRAWDLLECYRGVSVDCLYCRLERDR